MRFRSLLPLCLAVLVMGATGTYAAASTATNYGLNYPEDIAVSGVDAFVTNSGGGSVTEFNIVTGALVRVLKAKAYKFGEPSMIVIDGGDAFVAADDTSTVTEFNVATGALVRVVGGKPYGFLITSLAVDGPDIFATNFGGGLTAVPASVTEFSAATGALVRVLGATSYGLNWSNSIAISGANGFIVNTNAGGAPNAPAQPVTEFNVRTGAFEKFLKPTSYGFGEAGAVVARGPDVFISGAEAIVEVNATTGAVVHTMHPKTFKGGELPALGGHYLLISGGGIDSIAEFNVTTGALVRTITTKHALPSA